LINNAAKILTLLWVFQSSD